MPQIRENIQPETVLKYCVSLAAGLQGAHAPLGGTRALSSAGFPAGEISRALELFTAGEGPLGPEEGALCRQLHSMLTNLSIHFTQYYGRRENNSRLLALHSLLVSAESREEKARLTAQIFTPELSLEDEQIFPRWKLRRVFPNPRPLRPEEIVIQLNALYTLPGSIPARVPDELKNMWKHAKENGLTHSADYDHPVALFAQDDSHELIKCLGELDEEIAFEKSRKVFPPMFRLSVLVSVSVTHQEIDTLCGKWVEWMLKQKKFTHLKCMILSEDKIRTIKSELLKQDLSVYSVAGKYSRHFNALKYTQLLLERAGGVRAGFKLDTDEGIRSRDLFTATGKTWFQTLCHEYWGGSAEDFRGRPVHLGVNVGEYVNKADIDKLGYEKALRCPDVKVPETHIGPDIFLNKGFAHGRCTRLYNRFGSVEDFISHPVVKGGGYGITNEALRAHVPFTFSQVGRAEDQQFYFSALVTGCRGIFHPDLRIAHYKDKGSAAALSEEDTKAARFAGDMYRLVIFSHLVSLLPDVYGSGSAEHLKEDIDPMPGVFAGEMAPLQALLGLIYRACCYQAEGQTEHAAYLISEGLNSISALLSQIEAGVILQKMNSEKSEWEAFIRSADAVDPAAARSLFDRFAV